MSRTELHDYEWRGNYWHEVVPDASITWGESVLLPIFPPHCLGLMYAMACRIDTLRFKLLPLATHGSSSSPVAGDAKLSR